MLVGVGSSEEAGMQQGGKPQEKKREVSTLNRLIWSRCSIAPTNPYRSCLQCTLNKEDGAKVEMNFAAHQEKEKIKRRARKKQKKRENR